MVECVQKIIITQLYYGYSSSGSGLEWKGRWPRTGEEQRNDNHNFTIRYIVIADSVHGCLSACF